MMSLQPKTRRASHLRYRAGKAANQISGNRLRRYVGTRHPQITHRRINLPNWPIELEQFTIAHLSDFHLGELLTGEDAGFFLAEFQRKLTTRLDLVVVTGDILDFQPAGCSALLRQLAQFPSKLGTFAVLGNHDVLVNRRQFIADCRANGLRLLINEHLTLRESAVPIHLVGIDWAQKTHHLAQNLAESFRFIHLPAKMSPAAPPAPRGATIVLAHNPKAFPPAVKYHPHLVLSGHTHGGQLNLLKPTPKRSALGLGTIAHRYSWGIYEKGNSRLHVTSGIGSWFPFRVKCPAEIALLTIHRSTHPNTTSQHPHLPSRK